MDPFFLALFQSHMVDPTSDATIIEGGSRHGGALSFLGILNRMIKGAPHTGQRSALSALDCWSFFSLCLSDTLVAPSKILAFSSNVRLVGLMNS